MSIFSRVTHRCRKCKIALSKDYKDDLCPEHRREQDALDEEARLAEIIARRVYIFKCQECGKEFRLSETDRNLVNEEKLDGVHCCGGYCGEDRIEIVDADGEVTAVII
ncbi:MAG: hypothetical protein OIN66_09325 [Candidatus Methanoperedens sp.]|nr:hypothetical protein [Candidatus Methanoperedens sp.]